MRAIWVIKKSAKVLQSLAEFCIFACRRNRKTFSWGRMQCRSGKTRQCKRANKAEIANLNGWICSVKWLRLRCKMAETMLRNDWYCTVDERLNSHQGRRTARPHHKIAARRSVYLCPKTPMQKRTPRTTTARQTVMVKTEATGCSLMSLNRGAQWMFAISRFCMMRRQR